MHSSRLLLAFLASVLCAGVARADEKSDAQAEARGYPGIPAERIVERGVNPSWTLAPPTTIYFIERPQTLQPGLCQAAVHAANFQADRSRTLSQTFNGVTHETWYKAVDFGTDCEALPSARTFFRSPSQAVAARGVELLRQLIERPRDFTLTCLDRRELGRLCRSPARAFRDLDPGQLERVERVVCPVGMGRECYRYDFLDPRVVIGVGDGPMRASILYNIHVVV